jgi:DNA-directed RNA polymerase subunit RPC12/RpoP
MTATLSNHSTTIKDMPRFNSPEEVAEVVQAIEDQSQSRTDTPITDQSPYLCANCHQANVEPDSEMLLSPYWSCPACESTYPWSSYPKTIAPSPNADK